MKDKKWNWLSYFRMMVTGKPAARFCIAFDSGRVSNAVTSGAWSPALIQSNRFPSTWSCPTSRKSLWSENKKTGNLRRSGRKKSQNTPDLNPIDPPPAFPHPVSYYPRPQKAPITGGNRPRLKQAQIGLRFPPTAFLPIPKTP